MFKQNFSLRNVGSSYQSVLQWCGRLVKLVCSFSECSACAAELRFCFWAVSSIELFVLLQQPGSVEGLLLSRFLDRTRGSFPLTSDQLPAQDKANTRDKYRCRKRNSNPRSQQSSRCKPTPKTARLLGSACLLIKLSNLYCFNELYYWHFSLKYLFPRLQTRSQDYTVVWQLLPSVDIF
jgi:hypothetical protein